MRNFNQPVIFPESVSNYEFAFGNCYNFNQPVIIQNNNNSRKSFRGFFANCYNFNQNITEMFMNFNTFTAIGDVVGMFEGCHNFNQNIDIISNLSNSNWYSTFRDCYNFNQNINIRGATFPYTFMNCYNLRQVILNVNNYCNCIHYTFVNCNNLSNVTINGNLNKKMSAYSYDKYSLMIGAFRSNNTTMLNIYTTSATTANLITSPCVVNLSANFTYFGENNHITPSWTPVENGYFNSLYNIRIYNNLT